MICKHCAWEADHIQWGDMEESDDNSGHSICQGGTHCTCQHRPQTEENYSGRQAA